MTIGPRHHQSGGVLLDSLIIASGFRGCLLFYQWLTVHLCSNKGQPEGPGMRLKRI